MILGAVLQGGRSSRMGRDKAGIVVHGVALRAHARAALAAICDDVVLVGGEGADVMDGGGGPLAAVAALLATDRGVSAVRVMVCAVDQPLLTTAALSTLLAACGDDEVISFDGEPLPVVLGAGARARVVSAVLTGEARLRAVMSRVLPCDPATRAALADADTPEALAALAARLGGDVAATDRRRPTSLP